MVEDSADGDLLNRVQGRTVAVFHAHPDDEVFATAAATTALAAAGGRVRLFVATGGELPEQSADPGLDEAAARGVREGRLERSCELLGISNWSYLTRPGQWLDSVEQSRTLAAAPTELVAAAVRSVIDEHRPEIVLSVGQDGLTGHPDHIAMHDAVAAALQLPGWSPGHAWGAMVLDADVRTAHALIEQHAPGVGSQVGHENLRGAPASRIEQTIRSERGGVARKRAMDLYLDGLGSASIDHLTHRLRLRGASLILRSVFDGAGWGTEHYTRI